MAGSTYRRNVTLADLITGSNPDLAPPVAPSQPTASFLAGEGGGLAPAERNRLLEILTQPESVGPPPEIDEGTRGTQIGSNVFAALGDALGTYASILGGGRAPNFMQQLQAKREFDKETKRTYGARKARAETESKQRKAQYLLGKDEAAMEASARKAAEEKADRLLREKITRDTEAEQGRRSFELAKQAEEHRLDQDEQAARFKHEEGMKRLEASLKTGDNPKAEKQLQSFALGSRIANGIIRGVPEGKDGPAIPPLVNRLLGDPENKVPPQTPEEIRREYEDEMTQEGIFGSARDLARDYFNERLIRAYREAQKASQPPPLGQ
jgi:hypothetical protein